MSEETQTTESDKEENLQKLREKAEALEARNAELLPAAVNETVRNVGLDPNEGNGLVLKDLLGDDASEEKAKELVAKYGWEASESERAPTQTKQEQAAQAGADKLADLQSVTTPDEPQNIDQQIANLDAQLRAARAAQNWDDVKALGNQLMQLNTAKMRASVASHV